MADNSGVSVVTGVPLAGRCTCTVGSMTAPSYVSSRLGPPISALSELNCFQCSVSPLGANIPRP